MTQSTIVSVEGPRKAQKKEVDKMLRGFGVSGVACRAIASLYRLEGSADQKQVEQVSQQLLCDAVVEKFYVNDFPMNKQIFFADVWYKPGVTDAPGDSVLKAIRDLKVDSVEKAFSGTRYVFSVSSQLKGSAEKRLADFAAKNLLNPLIQECKIIKP